MSAYTEPLRYESTDIFVGGTWRVRIVPLDGIATEVRALSGARRLVRVLSGFTYHCPRTGKSYTIEIGRLTDLGSIPAVARTFLSPDDPWAQAYVLHDYLLETGLVDRRTADLILWDALALPYRAYARDGTMYRVVCPPATRAAIYYAVRAAGIFG